MRLTRFTTAFILLPLLSTGAMAQQAPQATDVPDMAQIEQAYRTGDFALVRRGLEQLAQTTGSALAQYRYGRVLVEGRGGAQDIDAAVMWLQRAVEQNHAEAAVLLAKIYLSDLEGDVPLQTKGDPARAAELLKLAAALGDAKGQVQLAQLYAAGVGVEKDDKAAFRWLLAAARAQDAQAQFGLARAYMRGLGTEKNSEEAVRWLTEAAKANHAPAQLSLGRVYDRGIGVPQSGQQALQAYRAAAENGVVVAQQILGTRLVMGAQDITPDPEEGLRWLKAAAGQGAPEAMAVLGRAYLTGTGVAADEVEAARWYGKAAQYDHGRAKTSLAAMYESGRGVEVDFEAALTLYQQALGIDDGNAAAARLGQLAADGALEGRFAPQRMVPWALAAIEAGSAGAQDWMRAQAEAGVRDAQAGLAAWYLAQPDTAAEGAVWLHRAAAGGDTDAMMQLGQRLMTGDAVELDYVAAHQWINIAATLGVAEAPELRATVTTLMTPEQVAQAQAGARAWLASGQPQPPKTAQTVTVRPAEPANNIGRD